MGSTTTSTEFSCQTRPTTVDAVIQWPEYEHNFEGELWKVSHDHPWVTTTACETEEPVVEAMEPGSPITSPQHTSIPVKQSQADNDIMRTNDDSMIENSVQSDPDYEPSSDSDVSEESSREAPCGPEEIVNERKFIIFERNLDLLLWAVRCQQPECVAPVISVNKSHLKGMLLHVRGTCLNGHVAFDWESQPKVGDMPAGHLIGAAALLFSGNQFAPVCSMAAFMNLAFFGKTSYFAIQKSYLVPVVMTRWKEEETALAEELLTRVDNGEEIRIAGDGQCDSPGYSAKYCTYSLMDQQSGKVVTLNVQQVSECTSSVAMETEAFAACVGNMAERGIYMDVFSSDRHRGVGAAIRKDYSAFIGNHQYDIFHVTKSLQKDLCKKAKGKDCQELKDWIPSINLHLWWACATCNGNPEVLVEKFRSSIFHASDRHQFPEFRHFQQCQHPIPLPNNHQRQYLEEGSAAHTALGKAVNKKSLLADLKKCTKFCHTGQLESYHALRLKYCPKRSHFSMEGMEVRGALAALDHNANVGRQQATVVHPSVASGEVGSLRFAAHCLKRTKRWSARPVLEGKSYDHVYELMVRVVSKKDIRDTTLYVCREVDKNIARTPFPGKHALVASHINRMNMAWICYRPMAI